MANTVQQIFLQSNTAAGFLFYCLDVTFYVENPIMFPPGFSFCFDSIICK
jgi:hypothetical protein